MTIEGTVEAICDRCLEEMELPISGELNLYAKYGEREEGNDDDFIILAQDDDYLDLSEPLYEVYMLNYPLRVVHPEGKCNEEMEHVLEELTMEEENSKEMSKKEAKKYLVFLVKEWSSSEKEVSDYVWIVMNRRIG